MTFQFILLLCGCAALGLANSNKAADELAAAGTRSIVRTLGRDAVPGRDHGPAGLDASQRMAVTHEHADPGSTGRTAGWGSLSPVPQCASAAWGSVVISGSAEAVVLEN
jgi:hypothetical protein